MCGKRDRRGAGARLNPRSKVRWDLPVGYRGSILRGDEAAARASLVSGPFRARPPTFFTPLDRESLRHVLEQAFEHGWPVIPRGAGTGMPGGNLGPHAIVEVGPGFDRIEWVDPEQGLIRAGAGAVAIEVDRVARERGWFVPFLPSSAAWCRVGGMVANNTAGARSFRYGAAAASVVEVEGMFADGTAFRLSPDAPLPEPFSSLHRELAPQLIEAETGRIAGWPGVRKNASGYALDRFMPSGDAAQLMVGSEGTLGLITDVVLRLQRVPEEVGLAVLPADSPEALTNLAAEATVLGTTTCDFLGSRFLDLADLRTDSRLGDVARGAFALVLIEVDGSPARVEDRLDTLRALGRQVSGPGVRASDPASVEGLWSIRRAASPTIARKAGSGLISTQFIEDCVVPPARLPGYLEGLEEILEAADFDAIVFGHAGDGNVHVNPLLDVEAGDCIDRVRRVLDEVTDLVSSLGGTLSGEHGDGRLRTPLLSHLWAPHLTRAFERVKERVDPRSILNPGVIRPLPDQDPLEGFSPRPRVHPG